MVASGWSGPAPSGGWERVLSVRAGDVSAPAMLGEYKESGGVITFTPRFAPSPGVTLTATFHVNQSRDVTATFGEPAEAVVPSVSVTQVYPSADDWPANTLRMYVAFSGPMSAGDAYSYIRVIGPDGAAIEKPFVEVDPELWDREHRRLTLLFDPGRLKRGLIDNERSGPPLVPGRVVTIEVGAGMKDARGAPLVEKFSKRIRVGDAVRQVVDPKRWRVDSPRAATSDLVVTFERPLDHALALKAISVTRDGSPVAGKISIEANETVWRFTPSAPWLAGAYQLVVDGVLEDVSGNRPGKLFDVDLMDPTESTVATPSTAIPFSVSLR